MLLKRLITAIVVLPGIIFLILQQNTLLISILVSIVSAIALYEYLEIITLICSGVISKKLKITSYLVGIGMIIGAWYGSMSGVLVCLGINIFFIGFIVLLDFSKDDYIFDSISKQIFGIVYIPFLLSLLVLIYNVENGHLWVLWLLFITFANDTGSYYAGSNFGKRHLAPNISPKKTYMGTVGGVLGAAFIGFLFCYLFFHNLEKALLAIPCSVLIAVAGQVGDLFASALKRTAGVKDSGVILPGHGGMLDRIDGLLFSIPVLYVLRIFIL
ncbi:MAG: phosphatidate cytidylyltransferase [Desulfobacteraceae bacterium]|nr:phosphatidate cytidylyltransferase [Desulfobacteraceae bacterium]